MSADELYDDTDADMDQSNDEKEESAVSGVPEGVLGRVGHNSTA